MSTPQEMLSARHRAYAEAIRTMGQMLPQDDEPLQDMVSEMAQWHDQQAKMAVWRSASEHVKGEL